MVEMAPENSSQTLLELRRQNVIRPDSRPVNYARTFTRVCPHSPPQHILTAAQVAIAQCTRMSIVCLDAPNTAHA